MRFTERMTEIFKREVRHFDFASAHGGVTNLIHDIQETGFGFIFRIDGMMDCVGAVCEGSDKVFFADDVDIDDMTRLWEEFGEFVETSDWKEMSICDYVMMVNAIPAD